MTEAEALQPSAHMMQKLIRWGWVDSMGRQAPLRFSQQHMYPSVVENNAQDDTKRTPYTKNYSKDKQ